MLQITSTPPVAHLGWDMQFTRIAQYVGPRILRLLTQLAESCIERGHSVYIGHRLAEDGVSSHLQVFNGAAETVCLLRLQLRDGWAADRLPGAHLDAELRTGASHLPVALALRRLSAKFSAEPAEVYYNAGDAVDFAYLQGPLLACL